jgi:hypothetical protein
MSKDQQKAPEPAKAEAKEIFYENLLDGELYALEIVENDPYGKTHKARNETHFWEGAQAEFKASFDRAD